MMFKSIWRYVMGLFGSKVKPTPKVAEDSINEIQTVERTRIWKGGSKERSLKLFGGAYFVGDCPMCGKRVWSDGMYEHECRKGKGVRNARLKRWFGGHLWKKPIWQRPWVKYANGRKKFNRLKFVGGWYEV